MFADPGISDELAEKLVAFVDREAGRDAPLTAGDEAMVLDLLEHDAGVQRFVEELRATNAGLDTLLDDVQAIEVPDMLVALIQGHAASDVAIASRPEGARSSKDVTGGGEVRGLRQPEAPGFGYGALAAAASIALFISFGALLHVYTSFESDRHRLETALEDASTAAKASQKDLADASTELKRLMVIAEQTIEEREAASRQLTDNSDIIQRLEVEQAALEDRYEELIGENERLSDLVAERTAALAAADQRREQVFADLSSVREALDAERDEKLKVQSLLRTQATDLTDELVTKQQRLADLSEELENTLKRSASSNAALDDMRAEQRALQNRLAALEADNQALIADRNAAEQQVAVLEANLALAGNTEEATVRRVSALEAELAASTSWLGQIAQYHRVYASTARRHLVEVGADEQDHIEQWLGNMLERTVPVPDLSAFGVTFQGARLLGVNDKPVAQLVYLDADDQPLALCIIPSTMDAKEPAASSNQDLNLVDWRDGQYGYAVVGWSDPDLLDQLTQAIRPIYDL